MSDPGAPPQAPGEAARSAPPAEADSGRGLVRAIGRWDLTAAVVNGVIGSAIFGMPSVQAALTGAWSPLAVLLAGLGVLTIVLCFAEVASRFRDPGGPYLYVREAFGPTLGFQAGWLTFWIRVTALAANLNVFADYLAAAVPAAGQGAVRAGVMLALTCLVAGTNVLGVRQATWTVDLFTVAKLLPLGLLIALGVPRIDGGILASQTVAQPDWTQAILLLMFSYGGFEAPLIPAAEAKDPRRDSAFALLVALGAIAAIYLLVQLVVVGVVPAAAGESAPLAAAFARILGPAGILLASLAAMVSIYGYASGSVLQSPRVLFSMADRGELPARLAAIHPRFRTPHVSIFAFAALSLGLALHGSFAWNATLSAIVRLATYGLTCVALLVLRRRQPEPPGFRLPAAWAVAPLGAGFCLWLLSTRPLEEAWVLPVLMGLGYGLWRLAGRRVASPPA